jgi:outer membrane protein assembly factor BamB
MYGGATYGGPSHSPVTRLVYVSGIVGIQSFKPTPLGNTASAGTGTIRGERDEPFPFTGTLTAYDPATGEQAWQTSLSAPAAAGSLTTAGNVIFQGTGSNYARTSKPLFQAFDARSGKPLFTLNTGALVTSEPVTYTIDGKQYVSVVSTDTVITLALP